MKKEIVISEVKAQTGKKVKIPKIKYAKNLRLGVLNGDKSSIRKVIEIYYLAPEAKTKQEVIAMDIISEAFFDADEFCE